MEILKSINLAFAFLLELCLLAALGYWGYHTGQSTLMRWLLMIGAPLVLAVVWGVFLAPKSVVALPSGVKLAGKGIAFVVGALALGSVGQSTWVAIFAVAVAINMGLIVIWRQ